MRLKLSCLGKWKIFLVLLCLVFCLHLTASRRELLPNVVIGDPNDGTNDILGPPISAIEFEASKNLNIEEEPNFEDDPLNQSNFFEGDIIIDSEDELYQLLQGDPDAQMTAALNSDKTWPSGVIPYVISNSFSPIERQVIARAMEEYHERTCIHFTPRSNHKDYIYIIRGLGCSSSVGRKGGEQFVSLGEGCVTFGITLHEFMHAAGFWHEQSRSDRDSYVTIYWNNIPPKIHMQFKKRTIGITSDLGLPYDYDSLMHYNVEEFTSKRGCPTIVPKDPDNDIGQRKGFSELNVKSLNMLYKCPGARTDLDPIREPLECSDNLKFCPTWKARGYCSSNFDFMRQYCKDSCHVCGTPTYEDILPNCSVFIGKGFCSSNHAFMNIYCQKSCNACATK